MRFLHSSVLSRCLNALPDAWKGGLRYSCGIVPGREDAVPYADFRGYSYRAYAASSVDATLPREVWFEIFTADGNQSLVAPTKLDGNFRKRRQA